MEGNIYFGPLSKCAAGGRPGCGRPACGAWSAHACVAAAPQTRLAGLLRALCYMLRSWIVEIQSNVDPM
eukprot:7667950-Heterocapsa_arctica.AAC.1